MRRKSRPGRDRTLAASISGPTLYRLIHSASKRFRSCVTNTLPDWCLNPWRYFLGIFYLTENVRPHVRNGNYPVHPFTVALVRVKHICSVLYTLRMMYGLHTFLCFNLLSSKSALDEFGVLFVIHYNQYWEGVNLSTRNVFFSLPHSPFNLQVGKNNCLTHNNVCSRCIRSV